MPKQVPYGIQVLKRLWDDAAGLLTEYDEFAENSDNPAVKCLASSLCVQRQKDLDEIARVWHAHPHTKSLRRPEGMDAVPPPDEDFEAYMGQLDGDDPMANPDYEDFLMDEGADGEDEEGPLGGQDFMQALGSQLGPDEALDLQKQLGEVADFLSGLGEYGDAEEAALNEDEDEEGPLDPLAQRKRKSFPRYLQAEMKSHAAKLGAMRAKVMPEHEMLGDELGQDHDILSGIADRRLNRDSEEPLDRAELDQIGKAEKSLRSIISRRRRGRFPRSDFQKRGQKSLEPNTRDVEAISKSVEEQTKTIETLQSNLTALARLL